MRAILVRHGRAARGVEDLDPPLDELGRAQAERAATALGSSGATRVLVSPLRRARETAAPIARELGVEPEIRQEFSEVFDASTSTGERVSAIGPLLQGRWSEQNDELAEFRRRVLAALADLDGDDAVIIVSHFVAISAAIGFAAGDDRVAPGALPNASITTLEIDGARLSLVDAANVEHLDNDQVTHRATALRGAR